MPDLRKVFRNIMLRPLLTWVADRLRTLERQPLLLGACLPLLALCLGLAGATPSPHGNAVELSANNPSRHWFSSIPIKSILYQRITNNCSYINVL